MHFQVCLCNGFAHGAKNELTDRVNHDIPTFFAKVVTSISCNRAHVKTSYNLTPITNSYLSVIRLFYTSYHLFTPRVIRLLDANWSDFFLVCFETLSNVPATRELHLSLPAPLCPCGYSYLSTIYICIWIHTFTIICQTYLLPRMISQ